MSYPQGADTDRCRPADLAAVSRAHRLRPAESNPFDSFDDLQMLLFRQPCQASGVS